MRLHAGENVARCHSEGNTTTSATLGPQLTKLARSLVKIRTGLFHYLWAPHVHPSFAKPPPRSENFGAPSSFFPAPSRANTVFPPDLVNLIFRDDMSPAQAEKGWLWLFLQSSSPVTQFDGCSHSNTSCTQRLHVEGTLQKSFPCRSAVQLVEILSEPQADHDFPFEGALPVHRRLQSKPFATSTSRNASCMFHQYCHISALLCIGKMTRPENGRSIKNVAAMEMWRDVL